MAPYFAVVEERRLIEEYGTRAVNARIPGRGAHERYMLKREELLPRLKEYYKENNQRIKERCLQYYYNNKDKVLEKNRSVVTCPGCDKTMKYSSLSLHRKKACSATRPVEEPKEGLTITDNN